MNLFEFIHEAKTIVPSERYTLKRIAFLSNFTIQGLPEVVKVFAAKQQIYAEMYMGHYNQYLHEILNKDSELYHFNPDLLFIILDHQTLFGDFFTFPYQNTKKERCEFIKQKGIEFQNLLTSIKANTHAKIVVTNCLIPYFTSRGIIENKYEWNFKTLLYQYNQSLVTFCENDSQLFIFDLNSFGIRLGIHTLFDEKMYYLADMRISPEGLVELGRDLTSYILPLAGKTKKCLVLDLDNTLWGGVLGEEGITKILLSPNQEGKPFYDFQNKILELFNRGVILAVNSKNNYNDVIEVFKNHPHMILKEKHFAVMKINWRDKVSNMREIAQELNIGLDSLVFIDDDHTNQLLLKKFIPEVTVIDVPQDYSLYPRMMYEVTQLFNTFTITEEDLTKGEMYATDMKRKQLALSFTDYEEFLKDLGLNIVVYETNQNIPRISQLTQKTNQFNLTTKRYTEEEITFFLNSNEHLVRSISVTDKLGDSGITGVVILHKNDTNRCLEIDTFLLSCRILGKNIEFAFMEEIIKSALQMGFNEIKAKFIPTRKNDPAKSFLPDSGFIKVKEEKNKQEYTLQVSQKSTRSFEYITVINR